MRNPRKTLLIFVHPGSLAGCYEWRFETLSRKWKPFARAQRQIICDTVIKHPGPKIVVIGTTLDNEIDSRPELAAAVATTTKAYQAGPEEDELTAAAATIWQDYHNKIDGIFVTGIWCDPNDGCAWTIYNEIKKLAQDTPIEVTLDTEGACESDIDELGITKDG